MQRILIYVVLVIILATAFIVFNMYNKEHDDLAEKQADYVLTASALFESYSSSENQANEKYLNKVLDVSGTVSKIEEDEEGNKLIYLSSDDPMFGIICEMSPETAISTIKAGSKVTLRGICAGYLMDVALNRCVQIKNNI